MTLPPSGFKFNEYYLYANKAWEVIPSGVIAFTLTHEVMQNAPVIITSSGYESTSDAEPWGFADGPGKWRPRGHGFLTTLSDGTYDTTVKEFTMNPASSGKIEFNQETPEISYVEYEMWPSGCYEIENFNVNPIMRETDSGFLQITSVGDPAWLSLKATQSVLKGDGHHTSQIMATLYDQDLNRLENKQIIFEMLFNLDDLSGPYTDTGYLIPGKLDGEVYKIHASGFVSETEAYTDKFGQASAEVSTFAHRDGWMVFKAYYAQASGIFDTTEIIAYRWRKGPFVLDYSMLDGLDFLDDVPWSPSGIPGTEPTD
jgi:hypothetical protein